MKTLSSFLKKPQKRKHTDFSVPVMKMLQTCPCFFMDIWTFLTPSKVGALPVIPRYVLGRSFACLYHCGFWECPIKCCKYSFPCATLNPGYILGYFKKGKKSWAQEGLSTDTEIFKTMFSWIHHPSRCSKLYQYECNSNASYRALVLFPENLSLWNLCFAFIGIHVCTHTHSPSSSIDDTAHKTTLCVSVLAWG